MNDEPRHVSEMEQGEANGSAGVPKREPIFNVPGIVLAFIALFCAIHLALAYLFHDSERLLLMVQFSFHPWVYFGDLSVRPLPPGAWWTPVTYAFLHAGPAHLLTNCAYFLIFGTPVARRFGVMRFCALVVLGALGGAVAHWMAFYDVAASMLGASAITSAMMGAALRFVLAPGVSPKDSTHRPALSLRQSLSNRSVMVFVVVWFALNFLFGSGIISVQEDAGAIAWQAHIGGFLVGWLGFDLLDPVGKGDSQRKRDVTPRR